MSTVRQASPLHSQAEARELGLDRPDLIGIYRHMLATRRIEERGNLLFKAGKLPGSYYTGRGNEAASIGVATAMGADDVASPLHRNLGVHVVRGIQPAAIFCQFMGRSGGATGGRDSNLRSNDLTSGHGLLAGVSHLPAMIPTITGMALAFQLRRETRVSFACQNLADRGPAYGFEGIVIDGTDVLTVLREAQRAIERARDGGGPTLLELVTLRMEGHAVHDDAGYVPRELLAEFAAKDPLDRFRGWLEEVEEVGEPELAALEDEVAAWIDAGVAEAEASPMPDPATLTERVYG